MLNYTLSLGTKGLIGMPARRLTTDRHEVDIVTTHVARIPLPLPLADLRTVNVYAILGGDGVTLVDSGWADEPSESVIIEALHGLGFAPGDVRRISSPTPIGTTSPGPFCGSGAMAPQC